jgi:hypothetical protein
MKRPSAMRASLIISLISTAAFAASPFAEFVDEAEARVLDAALKDASKKLDARMDALTPTLSRRERETRGALERFVTENLAGKKGWGYDAARIRKQIIDAEAFKLEAYIATGVFPKRYFGYLDEQRDTAEYEVRMKTAARKAARACNRWLDNSHSPFHVTEQEIIVTFLAEGGAILLRERQDQLESIHPIQGIGLDDIATGFTDLEPLVKLLDAEVGTKLTEIVKWNGTTPYLSRHFGFEEAIAGTAAMWVWEKQIAERKLLANGRASLSKRPLDEQFVIASLVYNSGILFDESTITKIRKLDAGDYVYELSEKTKAKRWPLPVRPATASLKLLLSGGAYPEQPTSWSAVYHVLQRYGGYVGLSRFTSAFDVKGTLVTER